MSSNDYESPTRTAMQRVGGEYSDLSGDSGLRMELRATRMDIENAVAELRRIRKYVFYIALPFMIAFAGAVIFAGVWLLILIGAMIWGGRH